MTTMNVLDADGDVVAIEKPLAPGRSSAATSRPVALSTEDKASVDQISTALATLAGYVDGLETLVGATNTALATANTKLDTLHTDLATTLAGYVDGLEALETAISGKLPATLGQKAMASSLAVSVASDQATFPVSPGASAATGGIASTARLVSAAASTNAAFAKASAGRLYAIQGYNAATSIRYLKLYNKASAPTVGTDVPVKTLPLPPGTGFAFDWPHGYSFSTGIAYALTTGSADADTGALTLADVVGLNLDYI